MNEILRHFYFIDIVFERLRSLKRDFTGLCCRGFIEFFATQEFLRLACPPWYLLVMQMDLEWSKKLTEPNQAIVLDIVKNRGGEKGKLAFDFFPGFRGLKKRNGSPRESHTPTHQRSCS